MKQNSVLLFTLKLPHIAVHVVQFTGISKSICPDARSPHFVSKATWPWLVDRVPAKCQQILSRLSQITQTHCFPNHSTLVTSQQLQ